MYLTPAQVVACRVALHQALTRCDVLGRPRPPAMVAAYNALRVSDVGPVRTPEPSPSVAGVTPPTGTRSGLDADAETIGTQEVADLLGVSTRHVRRLRGDLDGRIEGHVGHGEWRFPRGVVERYAADKDQP